ncbi:4479_t:CDS:2 [Cetraspora pellucida]|uniref:4479_t:CDS:1 n=1 Tax=Cetraspora pellucida TaxID=1433469 RepID=A0ACA9KU23_9GLOM|nr:4479_t:CDS:2 [Cetraspora pellucida]
MPNASNLGDDMQVDMPQTKRVRITSQGNGVVESTETDWLNVVLNKQEVDPSCEAWDCYFQDSQVPKHKAPNSGITFATPFVFKPVNPAQGFPTSDSPNSSRRQESLFSSNYPSFSANTLSEDQVGKIVEILGVVLEGIRMDIWRTVLTSNKGNEPFRYTMAAFLTVIHLFFDIIVMDFLCEREEGQLTRRLSIEKFMNIFDDADNFLLYHSSPVEIEPNNSDLEAFFWYYRGVILTQTQYHCELSDRFRKLSIYFSSLDITESILSMFYTKHFLNVFAKEHQKDHGQFYTPREVMRFMWDRVLLGRGTGTWIEKLLRGSFQSNNNVMSYSINQSSIVSSSWCTYPQAPSVLDPCMGIGSFLCEFIHRITLAAQQCPSVWHDSKAVSHLIQSLTENIWGIEIDAFAFHLCKLNITIHMLPLYKRFVQLSYSNEIKLPRLHLFCNDTLNLYLPKRELTWEYDNLWLLRSPQRLKFDYIVTNPPYMIRKTGFISEPDSELFDERVLGKGGMQAYAYFFWFCVERCREEAGEICLISASQWMGLEFADKLRAWLWQKCHLVEFFQFEPFKVWRKIQTDSLIFRLRRRSESLSTNSLIPRPPITSEPPTIFLRYMNRKATLHETLKAYANFNPNNTPFDKDMHCKITPPYPHTVLPSPTSSYSFTFLMPTSAVSAYLHSITAHLPSLCDHSSMKPTWLECNPLIWHRGPNTNPVYALVVRTSWAYSKFGKEVCRRWLRPVFYWNGKNGGKEAEFWQKMGDELRLEKKESSPAEAYVPFLSYNSCGSTISKDGLEQEKSMYSLIMVDRDAVDKVRKDFGETSEFWIYLKEARKYLQTSMTSREVAYCGTSKCGIDIRTKIIHPINYGYFSKNQPRQRFFIDEDNVCVTNQSTTGLPPHFFLGLLNSTTIQHFLSHHCKYDQQGRMRLFRENMAKIPYAAPTNRDGIDWFIRCTQKMIIVRQMLYEGIGTCEDEEKVGGAVVEKLRRGTWQLTGREWQEKESDAYNNETSVVLREEQEGNWVMVKQCRGREESLDYSLCPEFEDEQEVRQSTECYNKYSSSAGMSVVNELRTTRGNITRTHFLKPFFESLLHASACLQYGIDQYAYSIYGIDAKFQIALEEELKIENFDIIITKFPRWNGNISNSHGEAETRGIMPEWGERLLLEVDQAIKGGENLLRQKRGPIINRN